MTPAELEALGRSEAARLGVEPERTTGPEQWFWRSLPYYFRSAEEYRPGGTRYYPSRSAAFIGLADELYKIRLACGWPENAVVVPVGLCAALVDEIECEADNAYDRRNRVKGERFDGYAAALRAIMGIPLPAPPAGETPK